MKLGQSEPFLLTIWLKWASLMYYKTILGLRFICICLSPEDILTELAKMLDFWVQFRINIPLILYCSINSIKKYCWCPDAVNFSPKNCIGVTLLVKILPDKNCIVIVVVLKTPIATPCSVYIIEDVCKVAFALK